MNHAKLMAAQAEATLAVAAPASVLDGVTTELWGDTGSTTT